MYSMAYIGHRCRKYRRKILKTDLKTVASDLGYSPENISSFEHGRNDNSIILLWYMSHGMTIEQVLGDDLIE